MTLIDTANVVTCVTNFVVTGFLLQKEVTSLKAENKNLKRLLLRQGSVMSVNDDVVSIGHSSQEGDGGSVTMRQKTPVAIGQLKETRCLSLGSSFHSSLSLPSPPGTHLAQKYSLGDMKQGQGRPLFTV
jgi:hypothetical protein